MKSLEIAVKPQKNSKPYLCSCGKPAFVDIGVEAANRYPCKECYRELRVTK